MFGVKNMLKINSTATGERGCRILFIKLKVSSKEVNLVINKLPVNKWGESFFYLRNHPEVLVLDLV